MFGGGVRGLMKKVVGGFGSGGCKKKNQKGKNVNFDVICVLSMADMGMKNIENRNKKEKRVQQRNTVSFWARFAGFRDLQPKSNPWTKQSVCKLFDINCKLFLFHNLQPMNTICKTKFNPKSKLPPNFAHFACFAIKYSPHNSTNFTPIPHLTY